MSKTFFSCLPLVPFVAQWLLPISIENNLYIKIGDYIPFFIFNICYFIYILKYRLIVNRDVELIPKGVRISTIVFIIIYLLYSLVHGMLIGIDNLLAFMVNNQVFVYSLFLFMLHPMDRDMIERTKYIVVPVAILLCLEVLLYSFGILTYSHDLHSEVVRNGVMRISTTIDAATGSAVVMVMLGVMILYYSEIKIYYRISLIILITVSIFLLQSIGSILVWVLYVAYYFYVKYFRGKTYNFKIKNLLILVVLVVCLFKTGVYRPFEERYHELKEDNRIGTGRDELVAKALKIYSESGGFGVGLGQTNYNKSLQLIKLSRTYPLGVHNYYLCVLIELGFWGLFFLIIYLVNLIKFIDKRDPIAFYLLLLFTITFCLEPVFIRTEFTCFVVFLLMVSIKKDNMAFHINYIR